MKYARDCDCCWKSVTAYTQLERMIDQCVWKTCWIYNQKTKKKQKLSDLDLTINQYSNFQKLQYFKIVYRNELWRQPTEKGLLFYNWKNTMWEQDSEFRTWCFTIRSWSMVDG